MRKQSHLAATVGLCLGLIVTSAAAKDDLAPEQEAAGKVAAAEVARLSDAILAAPSDAALYVQRGKANERVVVRGKFWDSVGDKEKVLADYAKAIELAPNAPDAYRFRAAFRAAGSVSSIDPSLDRDEQQQIFADLDAAVRLSHGDAVAYVERAAYRHLILDAIVRSGFGMLLDDAKAAEHDVLMLAALQDAATAERSQRDSTDRLRVSLFASAEARIADLRKHSKLAEAAKMIAPLCLAQPTHPTLLRAAVETLMKARDAAGAVALTSEMIDLGLQRGDRTMQVSALVARAQIRLMARDEASANADLDAAVAADPTDASPHVARAGYLMHKGDAAGAMAAYTRGVEAAPSNPSVEALVGRGDLFARAKQWDKALLDYTAATAAAADDSPLPWQRRALAESTMGQRDAAITSLLKLKAMQRIDPGSRLRLGILLTQAGKPDEGRNEFDAAIAAIPKDRWKEVIPQVDAAITATPQVRELTTMRATLAEAGATKRQ